MSTPRATTPRSRKASESVEGCIMMVESDDRGLTTVDLTGRDLSADQVAELFAAMHANTRVKELKVGRCGLSDAAARLLADAVLANGENERGRLEVLYVGNNKIGEGGGRALLTALKKNKRVIKVSATGNPMPVQLCNDLEQIPELRRTRPMALKRSSSITQLNYASFGSRMEESNEQMWRKNVQSLSDVVQQVADNKDDLTEVNLTGSPDVGEDGAILLADALEENTRVSRLQLGSCKIGNAGVVALCDALKKNTSVTQLYLANNGLTADAGHAILELVRENEKISKVSLTGNSVPIKLQKEIADVLQPRKFKAKRPMPRVREKTAEEVATAPIIDKSDVMTLAAVLERLDKDMKNFTQINLNNQKLGDKGVLQLVFKLKAIGAGSRVTHMHLAGCKIGDSGALSLASILRSHMTLSQVFLGNNAIGDEGGKALLGAVEDNKNIKQLALGGNPISQSVLSDIQGVMVRRKMKRMGSFKTMDGVLGGGGGGGGGHARNSSFDFGRRPGLARSATLGSLGSSLRPGGGMFGAVFGGPREDAQAKLDNVVSRVETNDPRLTDVRLTRIGNSGARRLAEVLEENTRVVTLHLASCQIEDSGIIALADALKTNRSVQQIYLANNNIGERGARELLKAVRQNETIYKVSLDGNAVSRKLVMQLAELCDPRRPRSDSSRGVAAAMQAREPDTAGAVAMNFASGLRSSSSSSKSTSQMGEDQPRTVDEVCRLIRNNDKSLAVVKLPNVSDKGAQAIADALATGNDRVMSLHLGSGKITDAGAKALALAIGGETQVTTVYLANNAIGDSGAKALIKMMQATTRVKKISLNANPVSVKLQNQLDELNAGTRKKQKEERVEASKEKVEQARTMRRHERSLSLAGLQMFHPGNLRKDTSKKEANQTLELVCDQLRNNSGKSKVVRLTNIGDDGLARLADALTNNTTAVTLHLANCKISDAGLQPLCQSLRKNHTVQQLYLGNNNIHDGGASLLLELMSKNKKITKVAIDGNPMSIAAQAQIVEMINARKPRKNKMLDDARFKHRRRDSIAELVSAGLLDEDEVNGGGSDDDERFDPRNFDHVLPLVEENEPLITVVDVNDIGDRGVSRLCKALMKNTRVEYLHLENCRVSDKGVSYLCKVIKANNTIQHVYLGTNKITDKGCKALLKALEANDSITKVSLTGNPVSFTVMSKLEKLLSAKKRNRREARAAEKAGRKMLKTPRRGAGNSPSRLPGLAIPASPGGGKSPRGKKSPRGTPRTARDDSRSDTQLLTNVLPRLYRDDAELVTVRMTAIGDNGLKKLCEPLATNTMVKKVYLDRCKLTCKGMKYLASALKKNRSVTYLSLTDNKVKEAGGLTLFEALKENASVTKVKLNGNPLSESLAREIKAFLKDKRAGVATLGVGNSSDATSQTSEMRSKERADSIDVESVLSAIQKDDPNMKHVVLNGSRLDDETASSIAEALSDNSHVTKLSIIGCAVSDIGAQMLAQALVTNDNLVHVDLSDNNITADGAESLLEALEINENVLQLTLDKNSIGTEAEARLDSLLRERNPDTDSGAEAASAMDTVGDAVAEVDPAQGIIDSLCDLLARDDRNLTVLDLTGTAISDDNAIKIAQSLADNSRVTEVNLKGCQLSDTGIKALAQSLVSNSGVQQLFLGNNQIGDDGAGELFEALKLNEEITKVSIAGNPMSISQVGRISKLIKKRNKERGRTGSMPPTPQKDDSEAEERNPTLSLILNLVTNNHKTLTTLDLRDSKIGKLDAEDIARALEVNTNVSSLVLGGCHIVDKSMSIIASALQANQGITEVHLQDNRIRDDGARALLKAITVNPRIMDVQLDDNPISTGVLDDINALIEKRQDE